MKYVSKKKIADRLKALGTVSVDYTPAIKGPDGSVRRKATLRAWPAKYSDFDDAYYNGSATDCLVWDPVMKPKVTNHDALVYLAFMTLRKKRPHLDIDPFDFGRRNRDTSNKGDDSNDDDDNHHSTLRDALGRINPYIASYMLGYGSAVVNAAGRINRDGKIITDDNPAFLSLVSGGDIFVVIFTGTKGAGIGKRGYFSTTTKDHPILLRYLMGAYDGCPICGGNKDATRDNTFPHMALPTLIGSMIAMWIILRLRHSHANEMRELLGGNNNVHVA